MPKPAIMVLLNALPRKGYDKSIENALRAHGTFGTLVLANALHRSGLLEARPDYTGFATDKPVPYRDLLKTEISEIVDELVEKMGL